MGGLVVSSSQERSGRVALLRVTVVLKRAARLAADGAAARRAERAAVVRSMAADMTVMFGKMVSSSCNVGERIGMAGMAGRAISSYSHGGVCRALLLLSPSAEASRVYVIL